MKRTRAAALVLLASWLAHAAAVGDATAAAAGVSWNAGPLEARLTEAREAGKLVLVDCWATWCRYCHQMDRDVWSSDVLAKSLASRIVAVKLEVDASRGIGAEFNARYDIDGLPAVLVLDPEDGTELARLSGYQRESAILELVDAAWESVKGEETRDDRAATAEAALVAASRAFIAGDTAAAEEAALLVISTDPLCADDAADDAAVILAEILPRDGRSGEALEIIAGAAARCARADRGPQLWSRLADLTGEISGDAARIEILSQKMSLYPADDAVTLEYLRSAAGIDLAPEELREAARLAETLSARLPDDPEPYGLAARFAWAAEEDEAALALLEQAIRLDPHDAALRELRLRIILQQGRP